MAKIELPYRYEPRGYQLPVWRHMERPVEGLRAAAEWHRRAGKDLFGINLTAVKSQERVGTYWHVLPTYKQGRNIVWNGFTKEGRQFLDYIPDEIVANKNTTEMRYTFKNKSIYQVVGTDNINSLVGTNPVGVIMSEYSLHDPAAWDYLRPILAENGGWALFIYTLRGKNHGYKLGQLAKGLMQQGNDKWFYEKLVAGDKGTKREDGTPVISDAMIQAERESGMPEELILQEFYCSADAPLVGAYYSTQMRWLENQLSKILVDAQGNPVSDRFGTHITWEPRLPVDTWWDLGYDDSTTIWFVQHHAGEIRLIDYYENSGESLAHYVKYIKSLPYTYNRHLAPHDISVHEYSTGITRIQAAANLGLKFYPVPKHMVEDGIEQVRAILPRCWFNSEKCERGIAALREYCKEWNEDLKVFRSNPLHNWASHGADAFRTGAWGHKERRKNRANKNRQEDNYDYLRGRPVSSDVGRHRIIR